LHVAGQKFAMLEMKATVSQLLRNYKLLPGTTPLELVNEVVLKSIAGTTMTLEPRKTHNILLQMNH
jgi:cytochrome P450 family 4